MDGHVFIAPGDITQLAAHAIVYSSSTQLGGFGAMYPSFRDNIPGFAAWFADLAASRDAECRVGSAFWLPFRPEARPHGVLAVVATGGPAIEEDKASIAVRVAIDAAGMAGPRRRRRCPPPTSTRLFPDTPPCPGRRRCRRTTPMNLPNYAISVLTDALARLKFDITLHDGGGTFRIFQGMLGNVLIGIQRAVANPQLGIRVLPISDFARVVPNGPTLPRGVGALYNDRVDAIFIPEADPSNDGPLANYVRSRVVHESVHAGFDIWKYAIPVATEEAAAHLVQTLYLWAKGFSVASLPEDSPISPVLKECARLLTSKKLNAGGGCSGDFSADDLAVLKREIIRVQGIQVPDGTRPAGRIGVPGFDFGNRTTPLPFQTCR